MPRYIDLDFLSKFPHWERIVKELECAPTADVQEVKHAHWIDTYVVIEKEVQHHYENFNESRAICSRCSSMFAVKTNYCPNCGARMDGDESNKGQKVPD